MSDGSGREIGDVAISLIKKRDPIDNNPKILPMKRLGTGSWYSIINNKTVVSQLDEAFISVFDGELDDGEIKSCITNFWDDIGYLFSQPMADVGKDQHRPVFRVSIDCEDEFSPVKIYYRLDPRARQYEINWKREFNYISFEETKGLYERVANYCFNGKYSDELEPFLEDFKKDFEHWKQGIDDVYKTRLKASKKGIKR